MEDQVSYHFATVKQSRQNRQRIEYQLKLRQQPKQSRMCGVGEKADRRPIDPPPIVQLKVNDPNLSSIDRSSYLQNPYYFMYASLMAADLDEELHLLRDGKTRSTTGSVVSSLYHLKDIDNSDAGFFVFPDLSVRVEGNYRLKLSLFEIIGKDVFHCRSIISDVFIVYSAKKFPGMEESTFLSRAFADQGLKIRIRKELRRQRRKLSRRKDSDEADTTMFSEPETKSGKRVRNGEDDEDDDNGSPLPDHAIATTTDQSSETAVLSDTQSPFLRTAAYGYPDASTPPTPVAVAAVGSASTSAPPHHHHHHHHHPVGTTTTTTTSTEQQQQRQQQIMSDIPPQHYPPPSRERTASLDDSRVADIPNRAAAYDIPPDAAPRAAATYLAQRQHGSSPALEPVPLMRVHHPPPPPPLPNQQDQQQQQQQQQQQPMAVPMDSSRAPWPSEYQWRRRSEEQQMYAPSQHVASGHGGLASVSVSSINNNSNNNTKGVPVVEGTAITAAPRYYPEYAQQRNTTLSHHHPHQLHHHHPTLHPLFSTPEQHDTLCTLPSSLDPRSDSPLLFSGDDGGTGGPRTTGGDSIRSSSGVFAERSRTPSVINSLLTQMHIDPKVMSRKDGFSIPTTTATKTSSWKIQGKDGEHGWF